jgi:hypothetical protein
MFISFLFQLTPNVSAKIRRDFEVVSCRTVKT